MPRLPSQEFFVANSASRNAASRAARQDQLDQNPYLTKQDGRLTITPEGFTYLERVLTDSHGQVYVFNHNIPPVMVAAAMARLSRRPGDMRLTVLEEFAAAGESEANALIQRVVTAYGDDSVQQLTGMHVVVEGASNILTKLLEWGRFMGALEQSSRYIFFDQKDEQGNYLFLKLDYLPTRLHKQYEQVMTEIFETYSAIVRGTTEYVRTKFPQGEEARGPWLASTRAQACDAARAVLPAATKSTVGLYGSSQAVESLIIHLLAEDLPEARAVGQNILVQARQVVPAFLERTDRPDRGGATTAYRHTTRQAVRDLANRYLDQSIRQVTEDIQLLDYWPKNEFDLVPEMLFEQSSLSMRQIEEQIAFWDESRKLEVFSAYIGERLNRRHRPGRALEKAHFEFEFDGKDYGTFRDLQRHRVVDGMEWQKLTPYYGYEIPELISEAGYADQFNHCFDLSLGLYQAMVDKGYLEEAQYATLFGHNMRYRFTMNLRQLYHFIELRTTPQGHPGYRKICQQMYDQIQAVYPHLAAGMRFVNQDEDPALTRLAAERATQYKLDQLGVEAVSQEE